jgi:hypothetical protein
MARDRYAWQLKVEDAEGEDADLSGTASDAAALHEALMHALAQAVGKVDAHDAPVADDEDGWELRAAAKPG